MKALSCFSGISLVSLALFFSFARSIGHVLEVGSSISGCSIAWRFAPAPRADVRTRSRGSCFPFPPFVPLRLASACRNNIRSLVEMLWKLGSLERESIWRTTGLELLVDEGRKGTLAKRDAITRQGGVQILLYYILFGDTSVQVRRWPMRRWMLLSSHREHTYVPG